MLKVANNRDFWQNIQIIGDFIYFLRVIANKSAYIDYVSS